MMILLVQLLNSIVGVVSPTVYLSVALAIVLLLTGFTALHMNYKDLSMVVASLECGDEDIVESFISDIVFFAPTVFFIVLRPIMNLGMAIIMGHAFSVAIWLMFMAILPSKGVFATIVFILAVLSVFFIKLFTAALQSYFLFIFSSAMRGYY